MEKKQQTYLNRLFFQKVHIAPLATFRFVFGLCMLLSIIRFWYKGWIHDLYIAPQYYFTFYGFDWVQPLGSSGMYILYFLMALSALLMALGYFYKPAIIFFFLSFTYIELIDKTNYLNHYYFVSIISFLLCFLPANRFFSVDVLRKPNLRKTEVSAWCINIIKFQLACVYFFAGVAKIQTDWLFHALPLKIWLPAKSELPIFGWFLQQEITAYIFSWVGCLYDLLVAFFLMYAPTRIFAYLAVVGFHIMTAILFPIGMFPYIMILSTLIFFSENFHLKLIGLFGFKNTLYQKVKEVSIISNKKQIPEINKNRQLVTALLSLWIFIQLFLPFRYLLYPADLFWHEQGYRFSWRVMLMEKTGYATFYITDPETKRFVIANNSEYLTPNQIKMMSTQPDMILQFAHFLAKKYEEKGIENPEVRAEVYVTLNGEPSRLLIDKNVDLVNIKRGFTTKDWVLSRK